jgi:hypothetical protein
VRNFGFKLGKNLLLFLLIVLWLFSGWPPVWHSPNFPPQVHKAIAVSQGPLYTGTGANFNDLGLTAWSNPTNIQGDTTSTAATVNITLNGAASQRLRASNFGFSLPSSATVNGVTVEVEAGSANNSRQRWNSVQLLKGGVETGNNNSDASSINAKSIKTFGGATDGWGASLTASDVNSSGFGVSLKIDRNSSQSTTTSIYRARISVDYTAVSAPTVTTQAASGITSNTATANGTITATGGENADIRGFVYDTVSRTLPGNVAPGSSGYANFAQDTGSFGTGAFTKGLTGLNSGATYYARAYAHNSAGYSYGGEISFTTILISVSITSDGTIAYGVLNEGESKSTIDLSDTQTVQNDGNSVANFNIKTSAPSGWSLGLTAGPDTFVHEYSVNSGGNWTKLTTADSYQTLVGNIAVSATQNFDMRITAPNPSTSTTEKTINITIQAVAP